MWKTNYSTGNVLLKASNNILLLLLPNSLAFLPSFFLIFLIYLTLLTGHVFVGFSWSLFLCVIFFNNFFLFFIIFYFFKFIYLWLYWVFVSVRELSLVVASAGHSSSRCVGLSLSRPLLLWSTGSRRAGSVVVAHGPSCSAACGILPDQGSNLCPLHWQADSQPLRHQGSPL